MEKNKNFFDKLDIFFKEEKQTNAASTQKRVLAYIIDIGIVFILIVVASVFIMITNIFLEETFFKLISIFLTIIISFIGAAYLFFRDGFGGAGIGKRIMGIQVIHIETKKPIGFWRSALRMLILRLLGMAEIIIIFVQPNHRRFGDFFSKTIVIEK